MKTYELIAPCHFGVEAVLKREIQQLGYEIKQVEDGRVTFIGDCSAICRANIFLRTTERIMVKMTSFKAVTFDELFDATKAFPWEEYIPEDGRFWIRKITSINSSLYSSSDIQSIMKKAMVERMKTRYKTSWFSERGAAFPMRVTIMNDIVTIGMDTSGDSLHRRGYRRATVKAPIAETLAAALIQLTPWNKDRILVDPFCGSGTFAIEAALLGANIAPCMNRYFISEDWTHLIEKKYWYEAITEAEDLIKRDVEMDIQGYDIDANAIKAAMANANMAEVDHLIHFQQHPISQLSHRKKYGFVITNPPYGRRLEEQSQLPALYQQIGEALSRLDSWSFYIITGYQQAEKYIGRKADKNRKIYNGMMRTYYYQYPGPKPPSRH